MSDIFTLVSSREELDSLIDEQTGTAYNKPTESRNNGSRTSIAADDNDSFNILDFSDWLRICYMNSIQLIDKTIRSELLTDRSILNHLVISSLYTIRYLLNDSYMRLDEYVYFSCILPDQQSFCDNDILNKYTRLKKSTAAISEPVATSSNMYTVKRGIHDQDALIEIEDLPFNNDYTQRISRRAKKYLNSYYNNLFDIDIIDKGRKTKAVSYKIRLFMPIYALLLIEDNKELLAKLEEHKEKQSDSSRETQDVEFSNDYTKEYSPRFRKEPPTGIAIPKGQKAALKYEASKFNNIAIPSYEIISDKCDPTEDQDSDAVFFYSEKQELNLFKDICNKLRNIEDCYSSIIEKAREYHYCDDPVSRLLFLYKLNRAIPLDYLSIIFTPPSDSNFDEDTILRINTIGDTDWKFLLYNGYYNDSLLSPNKPIEDAFSLVEKHFLAQLTSKYSLEELDRYLSAYLLEHRTINGESPAEEIESRFLSYYHSILNAYNIYPSVKIVGNNDSDSKKEETDRQDIGLRSLFERFVLDFRYEINENISNGMQLLLTTAKIINRLFGLK